MTLKNAYEYDQFGNSIKMIAYIEPNQVTEILGWEYDENGHQLRTKYYNPDRAVKRINKNAGKKEGNVKIVYNSKGEITSKSESLYGSITNTHIERLLDPKGNLQYENKYILNDNSFVKEWRVIDNIQNKKFIVKYTYDSANNEIESIKTDFNNSLIEKTISNYDENNLEIEKITESLNPSKMEFKYEYY
ncbi:hypothetical protein G6053_22800 [Sphingobacterium sp. DR205]|nr:hypothetical protein G6053_22800 [Sphingobacterium sp. DR205]